ncbi:MAG TPA: arylsulfotransferase family protein [Gaiellaceae bacterium]
MQAGLNRAQFLRRAVGAGVVVGLAGGYGAFRLSEASAASDVRSFVSRPDLRPPRLTVLHADPSVGDGLLFLAPSEGPGQRGVMIVDNTGEPVWFQPTPAPAMNFRVAVYRGEPVLTWWQGDTAHGLGTGTHVIVDRSYRRVAHFPAGGGRPSDLHELLLTPQSTALVTSYAGADADLSALGGKTKDRALGGIVQELELPSGKVLFEWNSLDHVAIDESYATFKSPYDYFHVNSIDIAPDGDLIVSARNTWAVYKLDRRSGRVVWRLGGKRSDFAMGPGSRFAWQHDARSNEGGRTLSLFDDGAGPQVEPQSRAIVLALDTKRMRATLQRAYTHHPSLLAVALGSMQILSNRNVLVGWGTEPYISEYGPAGTLHFDAKLPKGGQNYRVLRQPWIGRPVESPKLAVVNGSGYASWSGATEVAVWRLRTGPAADRLTTESTTARNGFETRLSLPGGAVHANVSALDHRGRVLGTSAVVAV